MSKFAMVLAAAILMGCSPTANNIYVDSNGCQFERVGIRLVLLWEQTDEGWVQQGCRPETFADAVRVPNSRLGTISRGNPARLTVPNPDRIPSVEVTFPGSEIEGF